MDELQRNRDDLYEYCFLKAHWLPNAYNVYVRLEMLFSRRLGKPENHAPVRKTCPSLCQR